MSEHLSPFETRIRDFLTSMDTVAQRFTVQFLPAAMGLLIGAIAAFLGFYVWVDPTWQWLVMVGAYLQAFVLFALAYFLARRDRLYLAALVVVIAVNVAAIIGVLTLERWLPIGAMMGFAAVMIGTAIAGDKGQSAFLLITGFGYVLNIWLSDNMVIPKLTPPQWIRSGLWVAYSIIALLVTGLFFSFRLQWFSQALDQLREGLDVLGEYRRGDASNTTLWNQHRQRLGVVTDEVRSVCAHRNPQTLFSEIVQQLSEAFAFYHVGLYLLDSTGRRASLEVATGREGRDLLIEGYEVPVRQLGYLGDVLVRGEPRIVQRDPDQPEATGILTELSATELAIAVPLRGRGDRILGAIEFHSLESTMGENDLVLLQLLADVLASSLGNMRLLDRLQESLEAERYAGGTAARRAWSEWMQASATKGYRYEDANVVPVDLSEEGTRSSGPSEGDSDGLQEVSMPLTTAQGYSLGRVVARKAATWTDEDRALLESLIEQVEQTLENARLYQDTQRRALREQLSRQITDRIRSSPDVEQAMRRAIMTLAEVTQAREMVAVIRPEPSNPSDGTGEGDEPYA